MSIGYKLFEYVKKNDPQTWREMHNFIRPHKMKSIVSQFNKHLAIVDDLQIFNTHYENIPRFLLEFCKTASRNFLVPGDPYGLLLTCRCTQVYTQDTLDKRHLKEQVSTLMGCTRDLEQKLRFELNIYGSLNQIYEISNKRKFTTIFVKKNTVRKLLEMSRDETCYLSQGMDKATNIDGEHVYISLKKFIVAASFVPDVTKIIVQKAEDKDYVFRHTDQRNILAFTDLKYVFKKCGGACYYFNLIAVVKLQFFKNVNASGRNVTDICNIIYYQNSKGVIYPMNRNGIKNDKNRSGLGKMSFEAVKQNYVAEAIKNQVYGVDDSTSKMYYGQQFNEGTGYKFHVLNKV